MCRYIDILAIHCHIVGMSNKTKKENSMKNKKQKRIDLGSISYSNDVVAQKQKFAVLEKIGFKKI